MQSAVLPLGTGKTFWLEGLGQLAVEAGLKVAWFSLEDLGVLVRRHRADDSVTKAVTAILRAKLIVVDDIGLLPVSPDAAEGFYRLVDAAYEKRSVAVSSNVHPAAFDELMPKTLATATVDRLLHHAHVCITSGESVRLAQATAGKGVLPLGRFATEAGWPCCLNHRCVTLARRWPARCAAPRFNRLAASAFAHRLTVRRPGGVDIQLRFRPYQRVRRDRPPSINAQSARAGTSATSIAATVGGSAGASA
jgi:hypothetical protein